jgi:hypothetical protein
VPTLGSALTAAGGTLVALLGLALVDDQFVPGRGARALGGAQAAGYD